MGQDLNHYLSKALARKTEKDINLSIIPDPLYIRGRNDGYGLVKYRQVRILHNGRLVAKPGLTFPYEMIGSSEDIKLAWY